MVRDEGKHLCAMWESLGLFLFVLATAQISSELILLGTSLFKAAYLWDCGNLGLVSDIKQRHPDLLGHYCSENRTNIPWLRVST